MCIYVCVRVHTLHCSYFWHTFYVHIHAHMRVCTPKISSQLNFQSRRWYFIQSNVFRRVTLNQQINTMLIYTCIHVFIHTYNSERICGTQHWSLVSPSMANTRVIGVKKYESRFIACSSPSHYPIWWCGWGLRAFLRWWPPSALWAGPLIFYGRHWGCLNNPLFSNLGLCAACWTYFMYNHELWPTSVSHPFSSLNSSLGLTGGKYYQKITIPIFNYDHSTSLDMHVIWPTCGRQQLCICDALWHDNNQLI